MPQLYDGKFVLFRAKKDYVRYMGDELPVKDGPEVHRLPVYPAGMLVVPFVDQLAEQMTDYIFKALAEAGYSLTQRTARLPLGTDRPYIPEARQKSILCRPAKHHLLLPSSAIAASPYRKDKVASRLEHDVFMGPGRQSDDAPDGLQDHHDRGIACRRRQSGDAGTSGEELAAHYSAC